MILFVDDEESKMNSYLLELRLSFPEVEFKKTVDSALDRIDRGSTDIEALILDVSMPGGSAFRDRPGAGLTTGVLFYRRVREVLPNLPIVIFTNVTNEDVRQKFDGDDKCRFLNKEDYLPFELAQVLREIFGSSPKEAEK